MNNLARAEWDQWCLICRCLALTGVVTQEDLLAPVNADKTPGQKLLSDIRFWGNLRAKQGNEAG